MLHHISRVTGTALTRLLGPYKSRQGKDWGLGFPNQSGSFCQFVLGGQYLQVR